MYFKQDEDLRNQNQLLLTELDSFKSIQTQLNDLRKENKRLDFANQQYKDLES